MTTVRIVKNWLSPDLMRQTPSQAGRWEGVQFTEADQAECDFLIILNRLVEPITVSVPPTNIWHLTQEPPVKETAYSRPTSPYFYRYFTQDSNLEGAQFIQTHTALPWHVNQSYDALKTIAPPPKERSLSWITSNLNYVKGHTSRLSFLGLLQNNLEFDLWGRGFTPIDDKWDGLAPYRYALAVENYSGLHYWTEKIADCFLAWTMPIYYGATNIADYFPAEAMIRIDINQPQEAIEIIKATIASDAHLKNRDAIAYARQLVLDQYQFFPFITHHIQQFTQNHAIPARQTITLERSTEPIEKPTLLQTGRTFLKKVRGKVRQLYGI